MLVTNVIKREYPFTVRRKRDGEIMTMLITAESESAARLLLPDTVELIRPKPEEKYLREGAYHYAKTNPSNHWPEVWASYRYQKSQRKRPHQIPLPVRLRQQHRGIRIKPYKWSHKKLRLHKAQPARP